MGESGARQGRVLGGPAAASLAGAVFYLPASFAYALARGFDHNEHMYAAASVLRQTLRPYADFAWIQSPYWIDLQSLAFRLSGNEQLLLTGRLLNWAIGLTGLLFFGLVAHRLAGGWPALGLTALLALNRYFLMPLGEASNYQLAFAAAMAASWCTLRALERRRPGPALAAGLLLAVAVGAKLYCLALWPVFALVALGHPRELALRERWRSFAAPGLAGLALGSLPMLWQALRAPASFWFGNLGYHLANKHTFDESVTGLGGSLGRALHFAGMPEMAALLLMLAAVLGLAAERLLSARRRPGVELLLFGGLALIASAAALSPRPVYPQYFLLPLPFALLTAAAAWPLVTGRSRKLALGLGAIALGTALVVTAVPMARVLAGFGGASPNAPARQEAIAGEVDRLLYGRAGSVATLSPLHALEAGRAIEPELATGPFTYGMAHLVPEPEREPLRIAGPAEIGALLTARRPAAVLVGEEGALDDALAAWAETAGYEPQQLRTAGLVLWLRPSAQP